MKKNWPVVDGVVAGFSNLQLSVTSMYPNDSDEFELKFPKLSQAKLKGSQAESSWAGAFQFLSWNQNDKN